MFQIIEYKQNDLQSPRLAIATPWSPNVVKPEYNRTIWVFEKIKAADYAERIGWDNGESVGGNMIMFYHDYKPYYFDVSDCGQVYETKAIKPPRRGKDYTWYWQWGKWYKHYE